MNEQFLKKYKGLVIGIVTTLFAIAYLVGSLFIRRNKIVSIGAEFMPKIYGFILLFLGVCLVYQGLKGAKHFVDNAVEDDDDPKDTKNVLRTFALIIAYVASMQLLGFMLSSAIFLFFMTMLLMPANTKPNYVTMIIFSVALSVGTYFLFHNLMYLALPIGIIFGS